MLGGLVRNESGTSRMLGLGLAYFRLFGAPEVLGVLAGELCRKSVSAHRDSGLHLLSLIPKLYPSTRIMSENVTE